MIGYEGVKAAGLLSFRNFIPKHAFTRYCWLTMDSLVKRVHATRWTLCDALIASEGRLGP
jgi:hypothetical protein